MYINKDVVLVGVFIVVVIYEIYFVFNGVIGVVVLVSGSG